MAGSLLPLAKQLVLDNSANLGVGFKYYTYEPGTLTPKVTYQDAALLTANTNPVIANARGEVTMYGSGLYRIILKDASDVTIYDRDNVGVEDLSASAGAGRLGFSHSETYVAGTLGAKAKQVISVKDAPYNAVGDGVSDDQTAIAAAVAAAYAAGASLYWPPGTYLSTANIANFHDVKHIGTGIVKRGSNLFYVQPRAGQSNTLYCDASATNDAADGLSASQPIQQIKTAVAKLANYGPFLDGSWTIQAAAGTYKGGIYPGRNMQGRDFIKIKGPAVTNSAGNSVDISFRQSTKTGTFVLGETVTGGTSGATGTISERIIKGASTNIAIVVTIVSGAFVNGETITGATSGATCVAGAIRPVPTVIIDKAADSTQDYGLLAQDGTLLWLEDIKFKGAFAQGVYVAKNVYLQWRNVHVHGASTGLQLNVHCRYFVTGGIIEECTTHGINELFHVSRSFDTVSSAFDQISIRKCDIGLKAKENSVGHTDYINFEDCNTAMELQLFSGTNPKGAVIRRCLIGIVLVNSELHNESNIAWDTGSDAVTRRLLSLGNSSEIAAFGWTAFGGNPTIRTGHRPLVLFGSYYTLTTHTGTTAETDIKTFGNVLPQDAYAMQGKTFKVRVVGRVPSAVTLAGTARLLLRVSSFMTDLTIPSGVVGAAPFEAEFTVVCTADGANQLANGCLTGKGFSDSTAARRTVNLSDADKTVGVSVILANAADSLQIESVELFA